MKILMVCMGNICRSPLAEGILRNKVEKAGLNWEIDSAGTLGNNVGSAPHKFSQKVAREYGIDIGEQKCRLFSKEDMETFDKVYVMDDENYEDVKNMAGTTWNEEKVDYLLNSVYPGQNKNIPDPWYGGEDGFHKVYKLIDQACDKIVAPYLK